MLNQLSPSEEYEYMKKLDNSEKKVFYFVPRKWILEWRHYTLGAGRKPGQIDFIDLLDKRGKLKPGLEIIKDYQAISQDQWSFLSKIYKANNDFHSPFPNIYQKPELSLTENRKILNGDKPPLRQPTRDFTKDTHKGTLLEDKPPIMQLTRDLNKDITKGTLYEEKPPLRPQTRQLSNSSKNSQNKFLSSDFNKNSSESLYRTAKAEQSNPKNLLSSKDSKLKPIRSTTPAQIKNARQETPVSKRDSNGSVSTQTSTPSHQSLSRLSLISKNLSSPILKFGLHNPRFQCFLNTVVQCLFSFPSFSTGLTKMGTGGPICRALQMIIQECRESKRSEVIISCSTLAAIFSKPFPGYKQHDAPEFCRALMDGIDSEFPKSMKKTGDFWDQCKSQFCPLISEEFLGLLCSTVTCFGCKKETYNYEPFTMLMLELTRNIDKSISEFLTLEEVKDYKCEKCRKLTKIQKGFQFEKLPKNLIIQLKRFKCHIIPQKLDSRCDFELSLDLLDSNGEIFKYTLVAVGVHFGSVVGGHYYAYCLRDRWYKFDDQTVTEVDLKVVLSSQAYILCYKLIE